MRIEHYLLPVSKNPQHNVNALIEHYDDNIVEAIIEAIDGGSTTRTEIIEYCKWRGFSGYQAYLILKAATDPGLLQPPAWMKIVGYIKPKGPVYEY